MTTRIKAIIIFSIIFIYISPVQSQTEDRRVDWLHGFEGSTTHWGNYADRFEGDRFMDSKRRLYSTNGSIDDITNNLNIPSAPTNIGIGHSLGGIICRNYEVLGGNQLGGVITVHTPNQGASIASAVIDGRAEEFLNSSLSTFAEAIDEIQDHLNLEIQITNDLIAWWDLGSNLWPLEWILNIFGSSLEIDLNINEEIPTPEGIQAQIGSAFEQINDPALVNVITDLDPTSDFINDLNTFSSNLPRIEVHGYEKDKELFRLGCSSDNAVWNSPLAETTPEPDDCIIEDVIKPAKHALWIANATMLAKINPIKPWKIKGLVNAIGDVKDARQLLKGDLENMWEDLIGVQWQAVTTTQTIFSPACQSQIDDLTDEIAYLYQQELDCEDAGPGLGCEGFAQDADELYEELLQLQNDPSCLETVTVTNYVQVDNSDARNDGFILESEMTSGSADLELQNALIDNNGVNHMEVLNHPSMWDNFNGIFDNQSTFFGTPLRE